MIVVYKYGWCIGCIEYMKMIAKSAGENAPNLNVHPTHSARRLCWSRRRNMCLDLKNDLPRNHNLANITAVRIFPWPYPVLLRIDQENIQRFISARESSDKYASIGDRNPQQFAQKAMYSIQIWSIRRCGLRRRRC
jgi:hypothetical protein